MTTKCRTLLLILAGTLLCDGTWAATPQGVSPGHSEDVALVDRSCPTFSWTAVPEALGYELRVYALPETPDDPRDVDPAGAVEVLAERLPAGASSWTPPLGACPTPGVRHAWFVRAVFGEHGDEVTDASTWSEARFFAVASRPERGPVDDGSEASASGRFTATGGSGDGQAGRSLVEPSEQPTAAATDVGSRAVPTAAAAIKGASVDTVGEVYGVVGTTAASAGAGVAAANLAGGPDLALDGSADGLSTTLVSQSGVDRPSAATETFGFGNSGAGVLNLSVDGTISGNGSGLTTLNASNLASGTVPSARLSGTYGQALTLSNASNSFSGSGAGLTGVNAALLGGVAATSFATEAELASTPGPAVHWGNVSNVPADLADGDDNTIYSVGAGLVLDGTQLSSLLPGSAWRMHAVSILDTNNAGQFTSITIGADGLGLIAYHDAANLDLKVAHCNDLACASATTTTLDSAGEVGLDPEIAIGQDGLGVISYHDATNQDLKVAHCTDVVCSSATTATVDSVGNVGLRSSIAIGTWGTPLISYYDATNGDLKVAFCNDLPCSSSWLYTIDSASHVGQDTSIAMGAHDGLPLISYYDLTNGALKVAHCDNQTCSAATVSTIDSTGLAGYTSSIAIGSDGLGVVSYYDAGTSALKVAHCSSVTCSSAGITTVDAVGDVGGFTSITIGADGLPVISYQDYTNGTLKVAHCADVTCSSFVTLANGGIAGGHFHTSITIGADGLPLISCFNDNLNSLLVYHCSNRFCQPWVRPR